MSHMSTSHTADKSNHDLNWTLRNRENLLRNRNLLLWYEKLYRRAFSVCAPMENLQVLEVGSGASPLKIFYDNVVTSDILPLDYLDLVFDCHQIDKTDIGDNSLDVITMTNVLHHLQNPVDFLLKAGGKLKPGGWVIAVEPFFSSLSSILYRFLHHEPSDFSIQRPNLSDIEGPLSTANQALPQMIFMGSKGWHEPLLREYCFNPLRFSHYSALSYMASGGISRRIPIPAWIYRPMLDMDVWLADRVPSLLAAFFIIRLEKR